MSITSVPAFADRTRGICGEDVIQQFLAQCEAEVRPQLVLGTRLRMQREGRHGRSGVGRVDQENAGRVLSRIDQHLGGRAALITVVMISRSIATFLSSRDWESFLSY